MSVIEDLADQLHTWVEFLYVYIFYLEMLHSCIDKVYNWRKSLEVLFVQQYVTVVLLGLCVCGHIV